MAELGDAAKLDIANKLSLGISSSNTDKNYFEEALPWLPTVRLEDLFTETVPFAADAATADANTTSTSAVVEKNVLYVLDEIPLSNEQGWAAYTTPGDTTSERLINWLNPTLFGDGYHFQLFENDNTPINLTDGRFQVDNRNGIVRFDEGFTPSDLGLATPLKLTFYRYIGLTAADGGIGGPQGDPGPAGDPGATGDPGADGIGTVEFVEEILIAQDISASDGDIILNSTLSIGTNDTDSVSLFLNKLYQVRGEDYELTGTNNQSIRWLIDTGSAVPLSVDDVLVVKYAIGGNTLPIIPFQEELTTENISGSDVELSDKLTLPIDNPATVKVFLNKLFQVQGSTRDYTVTGTNNDTILWQAGTGTAVSMSSDDELVVVYGTSPDASIGPQGPSGATFHQETIDLEASELPIMTDVILTNQLSFEPDTESILLFLNRLLQIPGSDYELVGTSNQTIRWLAGTGSGADLTGSDSIYVVYAEP